MHLTVTPTMNGSDRVCPCCAETIIIDGMSAVHYEAMKGPTQVHTLPDRVQRLFTGENGSRWKESA
eukprot:6296336-Amphidinium_carterae.1